MDIWVPLFFLSEVQCTFLCALVSLVSLEAQHTERSDYRTSREGRKDRERERQRVTQIGVGERCNRAETRIGQANEK